MEESQVTEQTPFRFDGSGKELFGVYIVNLILTLATAGIYFFWAKTNIRRYLYQHVEFMKDRFDYHGTGLELFIAFLKLLPILVIFFGLLPYLYFANFSPEIANLFYILTIYAFLFVAYPFIAIGSYRYRVSRSSWRNIRFTFTGKFGDFCRIYYLNMFLVLVTMGIYYPWYICKIKTFFWQNTRLGNESFNFDAEGDNFVGIYLSTLGVAIGIYVGYLLIIVLITVLSTLGGLNDDKDSIVIALVIGIAVSTLLFLFGYMWLWSWYAARSARFFWKHTLVQGKRFQSTLKTKPLLKISLLSLLITVVTLGIALPWVLVMNYRIIISNLCLNGSLELDSIKGKSAQDSSALGDDMGSAFDVGGGLFDI
ncbi:MAG: YjgN family protein [Spirochaetota bacterium]|nr:YjgN family protein [Spirochaetota bacterium]